MIANIEAEAALLGAMMTRADVIDGVLDKVSPADFSEPVHRRIFEAVAATHAQGKAPSPVLIAPMFAQDAGMQSLGGPAYLAQLTGSPASMLGVRGFADQVSELASRRRLVEGLQAVTDAALNPAEPIPALMALAEDAINKAAGTAQAIEITDPADVADAITHEMGKPVHGVTSFLIPPANDALGKLRSGNLVIVAGRPGMGKSAFASSYSLGAAINGHGVLFVSLEMSREEVTERMLADLCFDEHSRTGVPFHLIREREVTQDRDFARLDRARSMLRSHPIKVIATGNLTPARLAAMARLTARKMEAQGHKLELIVVDYLQLMRAPGFKGGQRVEEVSEISRSLKLLAKEMGLPIMALSQLSRAVEARNDKRPMLSDLRESGSIEQDADAVCFLFRPEYYLQQTEPPAEDILLHEQWTERMDQVRNVVEILAEKLRHGRTGKREARFYGLYQAMRGVTE